MKAIILAAGKGQRLGGVVDKVPKPMLKIGRKPVLERNIEWLRSFGVRDIYINLHHLPDVIRDYFGSGGRWEVKIRYSYEETLLGTAGGVEKIVSEQWPDDFSKPFIVIYGDNLLSDFNLDEIVNFHKVKKGAGTICLYRNDEVAQSGIAVIDSENKIVKFVEKPGPGETVSNLVNAGIYVLEPAILEYIPKNGFSDFGKDVFHKVIRAGENLYGIVLEGNLIAIDSPELLEKAMGGNAKQ